MHQSGPSASIRRWRASIMRWDGVYHRATLRHCIARIRERRRNLWRGSPDIPSTRLRTSHCEWHPGMCRRTRVVSRISCEGGRSSW